MKQTVDVILFCYDQEQYIEQALHSIYAQELPKDVCARIIVADDASLDNTLAIIKRLAPESPFPLTFLPEEPNMGISKNYKRSFAATTADYVAILEGDDYWLPNHLTQHVEFLQGKLDCSMTMNQNTFMDDETNVQNMYTRMRADEAFVKVDLETQIAWGNQLGNLSACVFRGKYLHELPESLFDIPIADWMLGIMMAEHGYIGILNESTSVYRVKSSGQWAGKCMWDKHISMLKLANLYDRQLGLKYHTMWADFRRKQWQGMFHYWLHYYPKKLKRFIKGIRK